MLKWMQTLARHLGCKGLRVRVHGMAYSRYEREVALHDRVPTAHSRSVTL